jgi:hypothetical protein
MIKHFLIVLISGFISNKLLNSLSLLLRPKLVKVHIIIPNAFKFENFMLIITCLMLDNKLKLKKFLISDTHQKHQIECNQ